MSRKLVLDDRPSSSKNKKYNYSLGRILVKSEFILTDSMYHNMKIYLESFVCDCDAARSETLNRSDGSTAVLVPVSRRGRGRSVVDLEHGTNGLVRVDFTN